MRPGRKSEEGGEAHDRPTVPIPEPSLRAVSMQAPAGTYAARFGAGAELTVDTLSDLVWGCSEQGVFDYLGPQWFDYTGIPAEEQLGRRFSELLHPNDRERADQTFRQATSHANALQMDVRVRRSDGTFRWFRVRARPSEKSLASRALRFCGTCTDVEDLYQSKQDIRVLTQALAARITERTQQLHRETHRREQTQLELSRVAARSQVATRAARIGIWEWNLVDDVLTWDATMAELYGLDSATFIGVHEAWQRCLHPDDTERAASELLRALGQSTAAEVRFETSFRVVGDDAVVRHIRSNACVERDADGRLLRMLGANWDVTQQIATEQALLDQNQKLALSNQELEQFAYVASHDLQEPLRAVAGCAQLLERRYRGRLDHDADLIVKNLVEGAERMRTLIQDILALSRVSSHGAAFTWIATEKLLAAARLDLCVAIADSAATITHDDGLPEVFGDITQLTQLFQNLLGNAIKYRSEQAPTIHISADRTANGVSFAVRDNGLGIEPQYFERVFGIFQRLHTRTRYPGTGIGLAICKKIVERHAGRIWVESAAGAGSTFRFTLSAGAKGDGSRTEFERGNRERQNNRDPAGGRQSNRPVIREGSDQ